MTKQLADAVIPKHMGKLNLTHEMGRVEIAAKLHAVSRAERQDKFQARQTPMQHPISDE